MAATLTVANSSIAVTIEALYPASVLLRGYAADNVFEAGTVENGEFSMGIDGTLSAGFVYNPIDFTLTLQADSESLEIFKQVYQYEVANRTKLRVGLTVALPANGTRYVMKDGYMRTFKAPAGQRILQPAVVEFTFARQEFSNT